jgi:hypothetical protein
LSLEKSKAILLKRKKKEGMMAKEYMQEDTRTIEQEHDTKVARVSESARV